MRSLGQSARRLRATATAIELHATLADVASPFAPWTTLVLVEGGEISLVASGGSPWTTPLLSAPAIAGAVDSQDCIATTHDAGELSEALVEAWPAPAGTRVYLIPVVSRTGVTAVLCAGGGRDLELGPFEVLATVAGAVLDSQGGSVPAGLVSIAPSHPSSEPNPR